ncbi:MAG TPA: DUF6311 domain-containing protein [Vicinamibacterales bacterium]|nr:DUF6311 domain-containing protein [Vicinamibacterales bacterium]
MPHPEVMQRQAGSAVDRAELLRRVIAPVLAGAIGAAFAAWIGGARLLNPSEFNWVMKLDWQYHFLGWHFFRSDAWQMPPGLIKNYYAPIGTAVGYTDSIPLAALLLKPFSSMLPMPFQFLGLWLLVSFALQGVFGAVLTGLWTRDVAAQVAGGTLFVLVPTLLGRVGHAALASHWLLLWALWMYFREGMRPLTWRMHAAFGWISGLIHPYLAVMSVSILAALALRRLLEGSHRFASAVATAIGSLAALGAGLGAGWWCSGLFSVAGGEDLVSTGFDLYSMNLLGPVTPAGWSTLLPELPMANEVQRFEGFQYLGAGILVLALLSLIVWLVRPHGSWRAALPLVAVVLLGAIYSLSPRVTLGHRVVLDYMNPELTRLAIFRATGRFFWPAAYSLLAFAVCTVTVRFRALAASVILLAAVALQVIDLQTHYRELRRYTHSEEFHTFQQTLLSDAWKVTLPHYKRMLLYGPEQCGPAPVSFPHPALLAGIYGLSINTGQVARVSREARLDYCHQLRRDFDAGVVADDAIYLLNRNLVDRFRANARQPVVCATLDRIPTCVTAASYEPWKGAAEFR